MSIKSYRVFDTETSGLNRNYDKVISFGGVQLDIDEETKKFKLSNPIHIYINHPTLKYIPQEVTNVNRLTVPFLQENGIHPDEASDIIFKFLHSQNVAGYNNKQFDDTFIQKLLFNSNYNVSYYSNTDVMTLYQKEKQTRKISLIKALENENIDSDYISIFLRRLNKLVTHKSDKSSHDALYDSVSTAILLASLL